MFRIVWRRKKLTRRKPKKRTSAEYLKLKRVAQELVHAKILYFNNFYHFNINNVSIRNQKTRWGSCSRKGNLNFNYRIALLPPHLADYVIVHEICHLQEFNHSPNFWKLVSHTIPNYKTIREEFKKIRIR